MKNKNISDPIVVEIFRVEQGRQSVDTKQHKLNGVDMLQNAMLSYEPDLFVPEVLIKTSMTAPLIRNKIEELEVEEWQNTTALFAELQNLDSETKNRLGSMPPMHRAISVDKRNGKLIGATMVGDDVPHDVATELLEKAFFQKSLKSPMIFHQEPVNFSSPAMRLSTADEQTRELMGAIENYILQAINTKKEEKLSTPLVNNAFKAINDSVVGRPQMPVIKKRKTQSLPTIRMKSTPKETPPAQLGVQLSTSQQVIQPVKLDEINVSDTPSALEPVNETQPTPESVDEKWFLSTGPLNWKERKNRDRNVVNLTEKIIRLSKSKETPSRKLIVSYLASLSTPQYEFLEKLIDCFTEKPAVSEQTTEGEEQTEQASLSEKKIIEPPPIKSNTTNQQKDIMTEPIKQEEPVVIESAITNESVMLDPELEEYKGISEEEKALHFKILDYQKKHNVSYDHAAGVVLK